MKFLDKEEYLQKIPELCNLFNKCFKKDISPESLKWRYVDNPASDLLVSVEMDSGKIIANYSASPCVMNFDGELIKSALSMTTMTDPDFIGHGISSTLANQVYDLGRDLGYNAIIGFANSSNANIIF